MSQVCLITATGEYICGTGGWSGPKPGDPNTSDTLLHAIPAYGGIDLTWTWPDTFPEAVAYTTIYRGLSSDFAGAAVLITAAHGNFYYDRIERDQTTQFYYWIVVHSVYGTPSELIGPAWANAKPRIEEMIEELTGKIDAGVLANSLKNEISRIELNHLGITQEMLDRQGEDEALAVQITTVGAYSDETRAILQQEVLARTSQGSAFVSTVNTLWADVNGNIAAIQVTQTALVNDLQALASHVTNVESSVNANIAQVQQTMQTNIDVVNGKVVAIGALWTAQVNVNGLVGGFGVYNNGQIVEAGFDVDRFWVGRTGTNKRKPFIIENDVTYIDDAAINKLTFSKLRDESGSFIVANGKVQAQYLEVDTLVARQAQSANYVVNSTGWAFMADGTFAMNGRGGAGRLVINGSGIAGYHPNGAVAFALTI